MHDLLTLDALGTHWWITSAQTLPKEKILSEILAFQSHYSRFDPNSDLSRLNDIKCFEGPSDEFLALLNYGVQLFDQTRGVFNMSVGAQLEQDGYGQTSDRQAHISSNLGQEVEIRSNLVRIAPHLRLDFGGFGKGWLIDNIGKLLREAGIDAFIINGGGDILVGENLEPLYIENPAQADEQIGKVIVKNGSLASSSKKKRTWKTSDGTLKTHIVTTIENLTDTPLSVHVRAETALQADTFATIFLLTDHQKCCEFAQQYGLQFMEIDQDLCFWQTPQFGFQSNA